MRLIVIALVLLTGLKVWAQDRLHRSVLGDALVGAYRVRAIEACGRELPRTPKATAASSAKGTWNASATTDIVFGNSDVDVAIWDTENPLWSRRFRNPNLVLTAASASRTRCSYDVISGTAMLRAD